MKQGMSKNCDTILTYIVDNDFKSFVHMMIFLTYFSNFQV